MYHSIDHYTYDPYQLTVNPKRFEAQIRWIYKQGKRGVSMRELLAAEHRDDLVALTFDDGYADFIEHALPVIHRYGFTASLYIVPGLLGQYNKWDEPGPKKPLVTAEQVRDLSEQGMEIGSHGLTHTALTTLEDTELTKELTESRAILREITGQPVDGVVYPYGFADARVLAAVQESGYDYGCVTVDPYAQEAPYAYTRSGIGDRYGAFRLGAEPVEKWLRSQLRRIRPVRAAGHIAAVPPLVLEGIHRISEAIPL
jgi:peptidoglycan/xylan/chitin deacetylase (PgdA/CDA1 family)